MESQASMAIQVSTPVAVAMLVLTTAAAMLGAGVVGVTTVEAVPAEPQDAGPDRRHDQVVGQGVLSISQQPGSEDPGGHEARHAGRHVDDVAAGEVEGTFLGEVAAAPEHEGVDAVDEGRPQRHEEAPGAELDPAEHAPQEQQRGDGGEHELEVRQRDVGKWNGMTVLAADTAWPCSPVAVGDAARFARRSSRRSVSTSRRPGELGLAPPLLDPAPDGGRAEAHLVGPQHPGDRGPARSRRTSWPARSPPTSSGRSTRRGRPGRAGSSGRRTWRR